MRHDLDILHELFLPLLEEIAAYSPRLADELARGEAFWVYFNDVVLEGGIPLRQLLATYEARDAAQSYTQCEGLTNEYIYYMAQGYCAGLTNPTIDLLVERADARFAAEVRFQRDMLAAIALVSRKEITAELEQATAFAGGEVADAEVAAAFNTIGRNDLKSKLQQWDDEEQPQIEEPAKRKRRLTIPLMLLRFAAAAAVFTGGVVGVISIYNSNKSDSMPAANTQAAPEAGAMPKPPLTDTTVADGPMPQNTATGSNANNKRKEAAPQYSHTDTAKISGADTTHSNPVAPAPGPARLPHITVHGHITETQSGDTIYNVIVTLADDQGNKQTQLSKDGTFSFELVPHRKYIIMGRREHYRPVPLSLTTNNVKDTDADDVITVTLKMEGDR